MAILKLGNNNSEFSGSFSGSYVGDGSGLTNLPSSDPFPFSGDAQITGSLSVSGSVNINDSLSNIIISTIGSGSSNATTVTGDHNIVIGMNAAEDLGASSDNVIIGNRAASGSVFSSTRENNVIIGTEAGVDADMVDGANVVYIGYRAGYETTGYGAIHIGANAGQYADGNGNVSIGQSSMMGHASYGGTPLYNTVIGWNAGQQLWDGDNNVAIGSYAMANTAQHNNTSTGTVAIGSGAIRNNRKNNYTTAIGFNALYALKGNDTAAGNQITTVGAYAGYTEEYGYNHTLIGYRAGYDLTASTGSIVIGHDAGSGISYMDRQLFIGSGSTALISGSLTTGDIIFPSTASAPNFSGSFQGDGSNLTNLPAGSTPTLDAVTAAGNVTSNAITAGIISGSAFKLNNANALSHTGNVLYVGNANDWTTVELGRETTDEIHVNGILKAEQLLKAEQGAAITGSLDVSGSVNISLPSGSAFSINEPDIDQQGRLDFSFANGDPVLEIASRTNIGYLNLRKGFTGDAFKIGSDGTFAVDGTTTIQLNASQFKPNATNTIDLGVTNRRFKDVFLYSGAKLGWSANTAADLVALKHIGGTNTLQVTGSSDILLDVNGNISASGYVSSSFFVGNGSQLTNLPASSTFPFSGDAEITGSLTITGSFTAFGAVLLGGHNSAAAPTTSSLKIDENGYFYHLGRYVGNSTGFANNQSNTVIGNNITSDGDYYNTIIGESAGVGSTTNQTAIGRGAIANVASSTAIGSTSKAYGVKSTSIGQGAGSTTSKGLNIGYNARGTGAKNIVLNASEGTVGPTKANTFGIYMTGTSPNFEIEATGSSTLSGSSFTIEKSGSTAFEVIGSAGTLFSVDDDLTGTIFTSNDASGLPVLQADATGEVYIGKSPQSLYTTAVISSNNANVTQSIYGLDTSSYGGAFFEYTAHSGSDARAGSIMSVWNGSNISFTETTTLDIGDTTDFNLIVHISESQAQIASHATRAGYNIKTIIRSI